jgi:hypothetical protein
MADECAGATRSYANRADAVELLVLDQLRMLE